ncbi:hypothetical protein BFINE_02110 [Bacteroides finegoldii DSM 17565]|nr:hypothetical protein BFINE_02110 [Bacteroides finegoldii DSM 17565]
MAAFLFLITDDTDIYTIIIHYLCSPKSYKSETEVISVEGLSVEFNATPFLRMSVMLSIRKTALR